MCTIGDSDKSDKSDRDKIQGTINISINSNNSPMTLTPT